MKFFSDNNQLVEVCGEMNTLSNLVMWCNLDSKGQLYTVQDELKQGKIGNVPIHDLIKIWNMHIIKCYENMKKLHRPFIIETGMLCMCVYVLSHVQLLVTPWTIACQAPLSMGFFQQEYWSGLPFPPSQPKDQTLIFCVSSTSGRFFTH